MQFRELPTYTIKLYMAGDIDHAKQLLRKECYDRGLCVTINPTTYIYTGGEEEGFEVGFANYPRFPRSNTQELWDIAVEITRVLIPALCQRSALLVGNETTLWISKESEQWR